MSRYEERIKKLQEYLARNPADWQAVVNLFKLKSQFFSWKREQRRNKMMEKIAAIKRGERVGK